MAEFKIITPKKIKNAEMEKFKITMLHPNGKIQFRKVEGERIKINGLPCFIFKDTEKTAQGIIEGWNVSHLETGMFVAGDLAKRWAIRKAKERFKIHGNDMERAKQRCKDKGIALPINK